MEKNIAFRCPLINPELTIRNYKRFLKNSEKSLFSHGLGSSCGRCVHVVTLCQAYVDYNSCGLHTCADAWMLGPLYECQYHTLPGWLSLSPACWAFRHCGRREGKEGGKERRQEGREGKEGRRKERVTLPKGNFFVLSTKIWHLLWGKAIEFDIYKIF